MVNQKSHQILEVDADRALFEGQLQGMILSCHENERPLRGLAGLLDWRFQGALSHGLRAGVLTGKAGECAYVPVARAGKTYHLILVGCGQMDSSKRNKIPAASLGALQKNLKSLKLERIGISLSDFGGMSESAVEQISEPSKGALLWTVP